MVVVRVYDDRRVMADRPSMHTSRRHLTLPLPRYT